MTEDEASILAMGNARMSTVSIAAVMGGKWTEARVYNTLSRLHAAEIADRDEAAAAAVIKAAFAELPPEFVKPAEEVAAMRAAAERAVEPAPPPEVIEITPFPPGPDNAFLAFQRQVLGAICAPSVSSADQARFAALKRWNPAVTPAKLRYCRWFLDAGWTVAAVADLFDLDPQDLAQAVA